MMAGFYSYTYGGLRPDQWSNPYLTYFGIRYLVRAKRMTAQQAQEAKTRLLGNWHEWYLKAEDKRYLVELLDSVIAAGETEAEAQEAA